MADIVITEFMDDEVARELTRTHDVLYETDLVDRPADLVAAARDCRALIVRNRTRVDAELLDQCPKLRVIGRLGVGLERIDLAACAARNVVVCPARGANAIAVAEYVIAGLLLLFRGAFYATAQVLGGAWPRTELVGRELAGRALGLVGFGDIARHVAARAAGFGMRLLAFDPYIEPDDPIWRELGTARVDLDRLLADSDAVSLHTPLTEETRHLIGAAAFAKMRPEAVLINTARGGVVDETALVDALKQGRIAGAMIDVFAEEPLSAGSAARFEAVPNLILTPHIAGVTKESNRRLSVVTIENVLRVLDEAT
ncbi:MAG: hydroxyacid dehydrogenase [Kiloniellaceae bacterium]